MSEGLAKCPRSEGSQQMVSVETRPPLSGYGTARSPGASLERGVWLKRRLQRMAHLACSGPLAELLFSTCHFRKIRSGERHSSKVTFCQERGNEPAQNGFFKIESAPNPRLKARLEPDQTDSNKHFIRSWPQLHQHSQSECTKT